MNKKKYSYIQIGIASPDEIRSWSHGEVKNSETINYRSQKPEKYGLFCEIIFGPEKDYQCACGHSKRLSKSDKRCDKCGVDITESKVRRERMGHIELVSPVVHTWFLKNSPSKIAILLEKSSKEIEDIAYLASYYIISSGINDVKVGSIVSQAQYAQYQREYGRTMIRGLIGAEAIKYMLQNLDIDATVKQLREQLNGEKSKQKREKAIKRLEVLEAFQNSENKPEWMVMDVIPVIPPDLRPMVPLDGGRFASTDLNELYRRIINRNNRLRLMIEQHFPATVLNNERRNVQEAVDALIDNGKKNKKFVSNNRPLKSLSDALRGKQGRFRQNLLGKRVDFSGRSVICVGPDLKMYQCGIPREMGLILFKPFIINAITNRPAEGMDSKINLKEAKNMVEQGHPIAMTELEKIIVEHPVLLNRAPTLHRLGIQAFEPKLVEGKAIRLHPLVCTAFNADFDGDQMAVHVPLSNEAQAEARLLMLASKNILAPKDGTPIVTPSQDMVLGNYYLTIEDVDDERNGRAFSTIEEIEMAYENEQIGFHTRVIIPCQAIGKRIELYNKDHYDANDYLVLSYGKILFNSIFPDVEPYSPFICEATATNLTNKIPDIYFLKRGVNAKEAIKQIPAPHPFKKGFLQQVIAEVFKKFKIAETSKTLDKMKDLGFKYSTYSGITVAISDIQVVESKPQVIAEAQKNVDQYELYYRRGLMTDKERSLRVKDVWTKAKKRLEEDIKKIADANYIKNHFFMMSDSGARGSIANFVQLSGMRGLMSKPNGEEMDTPVISSFKEGLSVSEFFDSSHGARKGTTDTALKTAESGYLTRRLVDVSQDVIVTADDCHTDKGMYVTDILPEGVKEADDNKKIATLYSRIRGRFTNKAVYDPKSGEMIIDANEFIDDDMAEKIVKAGVKGVWIRTLLTCNCKSGVCVKCYGSDLSTGGIVEKGEVVGIIAAQSIGEPGTQLTMRTFHSGGVAGGEDITSGLPRVQELFEAREPKHKALIAEINGVITDIVEKENHYDITIVNEENKDTKTESTDAGVSLVVEKGQTVKAGDPLTKGQIHPRELLDVSTVEAVEKYILREIKAVYRSQNVDISDKHIEIIIKQMLRKVVVTDAGDTNLLVGSQISRNELTDVFNDCVKKGKTPPVVKPVILGITRSSLRSDSFLSAASFQETTRVLTEAAIRSKKDYLEGLKENIIIGGLIPAGTGLASADYKICEEDLHHTHEECDCDECHDGNN